MKIKSLLLIILFISCFIFFAKAQKIENTKSKIALDIKAMQNSDWKGRLTPDLSDSIAGLLEAVYGKDHAFKNGKTYNRYFGISGDPFLYPDLVNGQITINSHKYENILLVYDIYTDRVICKVENSTGNNSTIIINSLTVDNFAIKDKKFINFPYSQGNLSGYYELIYKGKDFSLLAKWYKSKVNSTTVNQIDYFSEAEKQFYLINDSENSLIKNKKDFINFFGVSKSEAKKRYKRKLPKISLATNNELINLSKCFDNFN